MSKRQSIYAITDLGCDGGVSPNAFVPRITAELRVHYPPNTVSKEEVQAAVATTLAKVRIQIEEYFEERDRR